MRIIECRIFQSKFLPLAVLLGLLFTACSSHSHRRHIERGEEYLQQRKFQEAVMEFRAAAEIDKTSADAHWGLARAFENLGQYHETVEELRHVAEFAPENLEAKTKLGNYYLINTPPQIAEAELLLEDILARDANFIEGHILKAGILAARKKSEKEVVDAINQAIALDPNRPETYLSLARYYTKINKSADAEQAIQKGISVNPQSAAGYLEYGRFLTFSERVEEAENQFKKAVEAAPKNIEAHQSLAEYYLAQRKLEQAEAAYRRLVEVQENSAQSRVELANFYAKTGREDDAIQVFNSILAESPEFVRARYRLGEIYLNRKETAKVLEQTEELLAANNSDAEALMLRARVKLQENKAEEAVKDLEEILKKQPSQKNALFYMAQARLAMGQIEQARAFTGDLDKYHPNFLKTRLLKIQAAFSAGESENALREANGLLDAAKNAYPNAEIDAQELEELRVRALTARGLAFLELGKIAEARTDLQEITRLSPNSSAALVNLAKVSAAAKNFDEATNLYEKARLADNKNFDALSGLVGILSRRREFERAHGELDGAIRENAAQKDILSALHYLKANVFTTQRNPEAAEAELKKSFEADENYLPAYSAYASIMVSRNQTVEAVELYKKVVERKPSTAVYTLIGMLEDTRGNTAEAEKNYRKALEITPDMPIAANNLAWLIAESGGNLDEALTLSQTVVGRNGSVAGFYDTLGWIYYKKELYSPAVEQLKKAVALDEAEAARSGGKANSAYRLRLAMALASTGDRHSARREVESSLQDARNLSEKEVRDARNLLASL